MKITSQKLWMWNLVVAAVAVVGSLGIFFIFKRSLPPQLPLWYSRPWGEDQLAEPIQLILISVLALIVGVLTLFFGKKVIKDEILRIMTLATGIVIQIILFLGLVRIVLLVI